MALVLQSSLVFSIQAPHSTYQESGRIVLLAENAGTNVKRELHYPNGNLPTPIIYPSDPDDTDNFDTVPLTAKPLLAAERTIEGVKLARWPGYVLDHTVREVWKGSDKIAKMSQYFLRRLIEYYLNPPSSGYIKWIPKDRGDDVGYWIEIESLTVGGSDIRMNVNAYKAGIAIYEVAMTFRIRGVAT